jgi:hypothetical protein
MEEVQYYGAFRALCFGTSLKGRRFQTIEDIQENAIIPGSIRTMEETLGTVYRQ